MSQLEPGTRLGDRYRLLGPLGQGGMGIVYRARDEKLARQVAVKTLPAERVGDRRARARLLREARAAAALEHPNIAQVYDVGETEDGGAFLVMELVRGESLRDLLEAGELERDAIVDVIAQVATALGYAHEHGVIHRDVKPDNVMVREDGRAALLDFGLAKDVGLAMAETVSPDGGTGDTEHITQEGTLMGTLSYLAPEQARGDDVGPWSDQFALAVATYEALTGRLPFNGENVAAVLSQILVDDAPRPSLVRADLPPALDRVLARALAKNRHERFPSTTAFADALRTALEDEPSVSLADTVAAGAARPAGGAPPPPSSRGGAIALTLVGLVGVGMAGSLFWPAEPPPPPPPSTLPAVVGCPVLEARGVPEPAGWLGAMAADLACRRLTTLLGGDPSRTRAPAELLELPRVAGDDFPEDPFAAPDAVERTTAAARALEAHLRGSVAREADGTMVADLTLVVGDRTVGTGQGRSSALYEAVAEALDAALDASPLELPRAIDPALAPWIGTDRVSLALAFDELAEASLTGVGVEQRCEALMAEPREDLQIFAGEVRRVCDRWMVSAASELERPALDRSSPAALALTAPEHGDELEEAELRAIVEELVEARRAEASPLGRAVLARGAVALLELLEESERARDLLITAAPDLPRDWWLRVHLVRALLRTPGQTAAVRALAAWHPGKPEAWRTLALPHLSEPERAVPWLERAYLSGGTLPLYGIYLAQAQLRADRDAEVRVIAARYATAGSETRLAGEYLRARIEIEDGRFGAAFERLEAAIAELPSLGRLVDGDIEAVTWLLRLSEVLGREEDAADPLVRRFVLAEPHRLMVDQPHYEIPTIELCLHARPELARPCLSRLGALREGRSARAGRVDGAAQLLEGAEHAVDQEWERAALAWRPLVRRRITALDPRVFERAGDTELAERIERSLLRLDALGGASPVHVRQARRAAASGDAGRARELARLVIDAWSATDVPIPAVDEMRALLATLPPE